MACKSGCVNFLTNLKSASKDCIKQKQKQKRGIVSLPGPECAREWQRELVGARESNTEPERARGRKREPDSKQKLAKESLMANAVLNFHFDYLNPSLRR